MSFTGFLSKKVRYKYKILNLKTKKYIFLGTVPIDGTIKA